MGFLRGLGADTVDMSVLPAYRRRFLATMGRRLTWQALGTPRSAASVSDSAHAFGAVDHRRPR